MKKERNELLTFLAGIIMLGAGLYILSQRVIVYSGFFGFGYGRLTSSLIMVPLIAGIVWLFATGSKGAKILCWAGIAIIIISVILSLHISLLAMTLFDWIILLILIFGGIGLLLRSFFGGRTPDRDRTEQLTGYDKYSSVDRELEEMKRKYK